MEEQILKLRSEGKSYRQIEKILGCSIATISYHCGDGQKKKNKIRGRKYRATDHGVLKIKMNRFVRKKIKDRARNFQRRTVSVGEEISRGRKNKCDYVFTLDELLGKLGDSPICYLTGRKIDLLDSRSFQFDHIVPPRIKEDNSLNNLGIACSQANQAKRDTELIDFIQLCKEVCENFGYVVIK